MSFTESAILEVVDQSTGPIKKINAELKKLFATARSLKSTRVNLDVNASKLSKASRDVRKLTSEMGRLRGARANLAVSTSALTRASADVRRLTADVNRLRTARVNLNVATSGLTQAQSQPAHLRAQAAQPITARLGTTGSFGGALLGAAGTGLVNLSHASLVAMGHAIARGAKEGVIDSDVGETSLKLKQLTPADMSAARRAIREIGAEKAGLPGGALYNVGQRTGLFSESLGVTHGQVAPAKALTSKLEEMTRMLVAQGMSFKEAEEGAIDYGKALEQMGRFQDAEGAFDPAQMAKSFSWLRQVMPGIGKEMTGSFTRQLAKYLSVTKGTVSDEAFGAVLFMGEEMSTRAAVGWNQAVKQLAGKGIKKDVLANQVKYGLMTTREVDKEVAYGRRDKQGRRKTRTVKEIVGAGPADENLLRTNLAEYVVEKVVPAMIKAGYDPDSDVDAAKFASQIAGDRTAIEAISAMISRRKEIRRGLDEAKRRTGDSKAIRTLTEGSIAAATTGLQNAFQSATGEIIMTAAGPLSKGMQYGTQALNDFAASVKGGQMPSLETTAKMAAGVIPMGLAAGVLALRHPMTAALGSAGLTLTTAGASLTGAAAALTAAAGVQAAAGITGGLAGTAGKVGLGALAARLLGGSALASPQGIAAAVALALAGGAAYYALKPGEAPKGLSLEGERQWWLKRNAAMIEQREKEMSELKKSLPPPTAPGETPTGPPPSPIIADTLIRLEGEIGRLSEVSKHLRTLAPPREIKEARTKDDVVEVEVASPKKPFEFTVALPKGAKRWFDLPAHPRVIKEARTKDDYVPPRIIPEARTKDDTATAAAAFDIGRFETATQTFSAAGTQLAAMPTQLTSSVGTLTAAGNTFATVFGTASTQLSAAGSNAAAIIAAGAAGAGAAYGNAAAARIAAAAANVSINVTNTVKSSPAPDTGSQSVA